MLKRKQPQKLNFFSRHLKLLSGYKLLNFPILLFSFLLVFSCLYLLNQRFVIQQKIRSSLPQIISSLNEIGLDIAYDNIKFNYLFFRPVITIENPQIYTLEEDNYWKVQFSDIHADYSIFNTTNLHWQFSEKGNIVFNNKLHNITSVDTFLNIHNKQERLQFGFQSNDLNIQNFADIKNISVNLQPSDIPTSKVTNGIPYYSLFIEFKDILFNNNIKHPLSSKIKLFSTKLDIINKFSFDESFLLSLETWSKNGGFIDIPQIALQWSPLILVGRGNIYLQDILYPKININTTSKGMLKFIEGLKGFSSFNSVNLYVLNILLSNKSFLLNPEDTEQTISTPIKYIDGKLSIENLIIKDFTPQTPQE